MDQKTKPRLDYGSQLAPQQKYIGKLKKWCSFGPRTYIFKVPLALHEIKLRIPDVGNLSKGITLPIHLLDMKLINKHMIS